MASKVLLVALVLSVGLLERVLELLVPDPLIATVHDEISILVGAFHRTSLIGHVQQASRNFSTSDKRAPKICFIYFSSLCVFCDLHLSQVPPHLYPQ
jgi:hypothetical protein